MAALVNVFIPFAFFANSVLTSGAEIKYSTGVTSNGALIPADPGHLMRRFDEVPASSVPAHMDKGQDDMKHHTAVASLLEDIEQPPSPWELIGKQKDVNASGAANLINTTERDTYFGGTTVGTPASGKYLKACGSLALGPCNTTYRYKNETDGYYEFRLRWWLTDNNNANASKMIQWRQKNWITNASSLSDDIDDSRCIRVKTDGVVGTNTSSDCMGGSIAAGKLFKGLGKSDYYDNKCIIDGNGNTSAWWNCAGAMSVLTADSKTGIPCYSGNVCKTWLLDVYKFPTTTTTTTAASDVPGL